MSYQIPDLVERLEARYGEWDRGVKFDPVEELVSCILSQHTTDATSFPAFARLRQRYPTWDAVVESGPEQVAEVVRGAGLANSKSRSIIRSLKEIHARTGAYSLDSLRAMSLQEARAWLTSLPGVGPKTASIVLCFALRMPAIPVDTHVYRVSWRLGLIPEKIGESKAHDVLLDIVPAELAYRFHTALVQHGRHTCRAPLPLCRSCVVNHLCAWFCSGRPFKESRKAEGSRPHD